MASPWACASSCAPLMLLWSLSSACALLTGPDEATDGVVFGVAALHRLDGRRGNPLVRNHWHGDAKAPHRLPAANLGDDYVSVRVVVIPTSGIVAFR